MSSFEIADTLLACLESAYLDASDSGAPSSFCHRPGTEALLDYGNGVDDCCAGLGWARVVSEEPVVDPGQADDPGYNPCDSSRMRITVELGVARCNPSTSACERFTALAGRMSLDAVRMRQAVCCARTALVTDDGYVFRILPGAWTPLDSLGGCAGGTLSVAVWTDCLECT